MIFWVCTARLPWSLMSRALAAIRGVAKVWKLGSASRAASVSW
jgi:hypothetical protein